MVNSYIVFFEFIIIGLISGFLYALLFVKKLKHLYELKKLEINNLLPTSNYKLKISLSSITRFVLIIISFCLLFFFHGASVFNALTLLIAFLSSFWCYVLFFPTSVESKGEK